MNVKKWIAIALAAAMTAAVLSGCGSSVSTETETVSKTEHPVALTLDANITALHMTTIVPKLSGKIVSAPLTKGQEIQSGEIVVQIDTAPYEQSVSAAESELIAAPSAAAAAPGRRQPAPGGTESLVRHGSLIPRRIQSDDVADGGSSGQRSFRRQRAHCPAAAKSSGCPRYAEQRYDLFAD